MLLAVFALIFSTPECFAKENLLDVRLLASVTSIVSEHEDFSASAEELQRLIQENREQADVILRLSASFEHIKKTFEVQLSQDKQELIDGQKLNQSLHESYQDVKHVAKVMMRQLDDLKRKLVSKDDKREAAMRTCKEQLEALKGKVRAMEAEHAIQKQEYEDAKINNTEVIAKLQAQLAEKTRQQAS